ncbi:MAG TPA: thioredoxin family protein [Bryobacteraceae bacterium]|nr:thioredoxin family protein [Bryobacteraceae bacterium]
MRALAVVLVGVGVCAAADRGGFEPLDKWKAAVLAGDQTALRALYISGSGAFAQTPEGRTDDPATEEPAFWSGLKAQGLVAMNAKVLEEQAKPDSTRLVLRVEMTFRPGSAIERGMVGAHQVWVLRDGAWRVIATGRSELRPLPVIRLPQPTKPNTRIYPDPAEAPAELKVALAAAKTDHKRVLVIFGANWCYDCHVLDTTLKSPQVAPLVAASYHVLHINIGDEDKNTDLAERFQVPLKKGIPGLAVLDGDGRVVTSLKNGEFESAAKIGMSDVTGFLERWKPGTAN